MPLAEAKKFNYPLPEEEKERKKIEEEAKERVGKIIGEEKAKGYADELFEKREKWPRPSFKFKTTGRKNLTAEIKGDYIPEEFRPPEEVEEEEKMKGPRKYVPIEEVPAPDSNPEEFEEKKEKEIKLIEQEEVEAAQQQVEDERRQRREAEREASWVPENLPSAKLTPIEVQEKLEENSSTELLSLTKQRESKRAGWYGRRERKRPPHTPKYKTKSEYMRPPRRERKYS